MASQVESIKWVPGTAFLVDGFGFQSPRCRHYFLTHAHSDHTTGLRPDFAGGVIYASPVTYRLLVSDLGIPPGRLRVLELNVTVVIEGVAVTPLDANHCPGAVCFLFEVPGKAPGAPSTAAEGPGRRLSSGKSVQRCRPTTAPPPPPPQQHRRQRQLTCCACCLALRAPSSACGAWSSVPRRRLRWARSPASRQSRSSNQR